MKERTKEKGWIGKAFDARAQRYFILRIRIVTTYNFIVPIFGPFA